MAIINEVCAKPDKYFKKKEVYIKSIGVNCIVLSVDGSMIKTLLIKCNLGHEEEKWSLPGDFLNVNEDGDEAVQRVLFNLTGLSNVRLKQLNCFGALSYDTGSSVISMAYSALIKIDNFRPAQSFETQWFSINELPSLIFDHNRMLASAIAQV